MKSAILSLFLVVSTAVATFFNETVALRCGTEITSEEIAAAEVHFREHKIPPSDKAVIISVFWHIISQDTSASGGNIADVQIASQMQVLNAGFANTGISFRRAETTRTFNPNWFNRAGPNTPEQAEMKNTLHVGDARALNIYTTGSLFSGNRNLAGYATFPERRAGKLDGVVIDFTYLPGGTHPSLNLGRVLTHEVGHWVGLYHTFQGGCSAPGDFVSDTPAEDKAASGCPIGQDSCAGGGSDPVHNFMDYTDDNCRNQFTSGQITRMREQMSTYRNIVI